MWHFIQGVTLTGLGRDDEALGEMRRAVELDPQFWIGWMYQGLFHALHGRHAESLHCAEKGLAIAPWAPGANGLMAAALLNMGRADEAEPMLIALRSNPSVGPMGMINYSLARGDMDGGVEWANEAADQRVASLVTISIRAFERRLRVSAGWPALLQTLNLAPAS
jgi:hypothetical protein